MDLATMISKALALVTAVQAADTWPKRLALAPQFFELLTAVMAALNHPVPVSPVVMMATSGNEINECCNSITMACNRHQPFVAADEGAAPVAANGEFLKLLAGLLLKLLPLLFTKTA